MITWSVLACQPPSFLSVVTPNERPFADGRRKGKFKRKLRQGYYFKWVFTPYILGVRALGAAGCSIRKS
jgi:hypothetical protein